MGDPSLMLANAANDRRNLPPRLGALTAVLAAQHFASHAYLSSCEAPLEPFRHATVSPPSLLHCMLACSCHILDQQMRTILAPTMALR
jgi:hypothetical protein